MPAFAAISPTMTMSSSAHAMVWVPHFSRGPLAQLEMSKALRSASMSAP
jgi:hypothetical protein